MAVHRIGNKPESPLLATPGRAVPLAWTVQPANVIIRRINEHSDKSGFSHLAGLDPGAEKTSHESFSEYFCMRVAASDPDNKYDLILPLDHVDRV